MRLFSFLFITTVFACNSNENNVDPVDKNIVADTSDQSIDTAENLSQTDLCGTIPSLNAVAFEVRDAEGEQNTYSAGNLSDAATATSIKIGRYSLFDKVEGDKKPSFNGKLVTDLSASSENVILFCCYKHIDLVPSINVGMPVEEISSATNAKIVNITQGLYKLDCYDGYTVYLSTDEENKTEAITVFNKEYSNYMDEDYILNHITESRNMNADFGND